MGSAIASRKDDAWAGWPRLFAREQLGCGSSARLILEIDRGELLPIVIAHHEAILLLSERPRRGEAALIHGNGSVRTLEEAGEATPGSSA